MYTNNSQTCRPGEPLALEVKHPHKGRTSVSRSPSTEQEVLSQFSGYSKEIGHFTRDPCKPHLKSGLQSTRHASEEVNTNTHWEHSYRMEHAEHFPAPMEMCMDDHHTQTTERTQRQHLQDIGHAEFPPGMESTPVFPGNQFQQGNEEIMDTGTFTLGNTILNRYPALSTHTHIKGWKIPTRRHFHASTSMLMQPHRWKLPDKDQEQTQPQVEKTQQSHPAE